LARLGDERLGDERLGDERLGDERLGDERLGDERLGDEEEVLRFPFRNEAGVDQKGERATIWLQIKSLRFIHCAARLVSASVGPDC
jgi:hypothetical protein